MPLIALTEDFVRNKLQTLHGRPRTEWCHTADPPGFYIETRATSPGQGTYYLRYRSSTGTIHHQRIGRAPEMDLATALKEAKAWRAKITLGDDPRGTEKAKKAAPTLDDYMTNSYLPRAKLLKRSWRRDEELYRIRIKSEFGHLRLNEIRRNQVQLFHARLLEQNLKAASANHHIKLLRHVLNLAVELEMLDKNPLSKVKLFPENNMVNNYMNPAELKRFLHVLKTDANRTVCLIALYLLATGARVSEALNAKWENIDLVTRTWVVSALDSKSRRQRVVPLSDTALDVLKQVDTQGKYEYAFINKATKTKYTTIARVFCRIRKAADLPHLRLHDLRHQAASLLINQGESLYTVQILLGHSSPNVTQRYAHLATEELLRAVNGNSDIIKNAMEES